MPEILRTKYSHEFRATRNRLQDPHAPLKTTRSLLLFHSGLHAPRKTAMNQKPGTTLKTKKNRRQDLPARTVPKAKLRHHCLPVRTRTANLRSHHGETRFPVDWAPRSLKFPVVLKIRSLRFLHSAD
jgi:hypothetical protein